MSALALVAACASQPLPEPKPGPRGLHANEHLAAARVHADEATRTSSWPEMRPDANGIAPGIPAVPWRRTWDAAADHERIAAIHRSQAATLQAEYDEACGSRSAEQAASSPLARSAVGGWPTSTGVIVYLSADAGAPDKLLGDLRCHRAWMMLAPSPAMDDCPLDLPGLVIDARGDRDGITLSISVQGSQLVEELHRRAANELEKATRAHAASVP